MRKIKPVPYSIATALLMLSLFGLTACTNSATPPPVNQTDEVNALPEVVAAYISTYQEREDWEKLLSFYSDSVYFIDVNMKYEFHDKAGFMEFYDWPNPQFSKLTPDQKHFLVEDLVVTDNMAIVKGRFEPFYWKGDLKEWTDLFTIWLHFDEEHKIIRQYDFIKYPKQFLPE